MSDDTEALPVNGQTAYRDGKGQGHSMAHHPRGGISLV